MYRALSDSVWSAPQLQEMKSGYRLDSILMLRRRTRRGSTDRDRIGSKSLKDKTDIAVRPHPLS